MGWNYSTALKVAPWGTSFKLLRTLKELKMGIFFFFSCATYPWFVIATSLTAREPTAI
jgi:hypothetical protein